MKLRTLAGMLVLVILAGCATPPRHALRFAVIGDLQYNAHEERAFPLLIEALNREDLAFVVHLGDFKAGSKAPCTDALFQLRREEFNRSEHPFVFLPGDNDWVDCRRPSNGSDDPLERLAALRRVFLAGPDSLGARKLRLERQSDLGGEFADYRENTMWSAAGVVFAAVNIQGSNDNLGFDAASDREHARRTRANIAWMQRAMKRGEETNATGIVLFQQANPGFELDPDEVARSGWRDYLAAFEEAARASARPILFVHGDTHTFRVDRPYLSPLTRQALPNVARVEGFGSPHIDWVRIGIKPDGGAWPFEITRGGFVPPTAPGT